MLGGLLDGVFDNLLVFGRTDRKLRRLIAEGETTTAHIDGVAVVHDGDSEKHVYRLLTRDGRFVTYVGGDATHYPEIFAGRTGDVAAVLTRMSAQLEGWTLGTSEVVSWTSRDGASGNSRRGRIARGAGIAASVLRAWSSRSRAIRITISTTVPSLSSCRVMPALVSNVTPSLARVACTYGDFVKGVFGFMLRA